ncbi:DUF3299 domain-containing protein [Vibrio superstes]|uniref:DUF3299 domain-containing protein n=1 Tax=Vibrio superstes NBRC 103154 TaxID=1219062 RepID=A0A511QUF4_9VIBR|nr:DUF3299 domain-containing protein [Vibrio superstes]GEM80657.1 hypothetical protein VSU01S_29020 [Vibrio superstes NBRC 103154]
MKFLKQVLLGCTLLCSLNAVAGDDVTFWQELIPQIQTVEDPFAALDSNQLYDLGTIARFREATKIDGFTPSQESVSEVKALEGKLQKQGVNVEQLFVARETIMEQRTQMATLPNSNVLNKKHKIPGFITPLEMEGTLVTKFFLVPTAGACIHTPPPPPNQIILVDYPQGIELVSLATPIWVEGELTDGKVTEDVNYADGAANVEAVYQLSADDVELYQAQ